ncbi:MAG TPA: GTP cyclohydrolase FolE2 [Burkholderiales bacterium]|nr:GTP cyclohydrolase FolE2 [Burkholderiales bacterium]
MNAPERFALPDIQAQPDSRNIPIDAVGIKSMRTPIAVRTADGVLHTIATVALTVGLAAAIKGTHMSRFVALVERQDEPLTPAGLRRMTMQMLRELDATTGEIELSFPYFVTKAAPVSGVQSRLDYDVTWRAGVAAGGIHTFSMRVVVPATSLCPCSKEISEYGAHNQRSHITIEVESTGAIDAEELIAAAERSASCEVYGLLKRQDEKYVTERAYDNPKFAEDLVRDVALALDRDCRVAAYVVEAENFESIHNHTAYARIARRRGHEGMQ